jgi:hypothetical protein
MRKQFDQIEKLIASECVNWQLSELSSLRNPLWKRSRLRAIPRHGRHRGILQGLRRRALQRHP